MSNYLTVKEVATRLNVTASRVQRWCRVGKLRAVSLPGRYGQREYRIPEDEVAQMLQVRPEP